MSELLRVESASFGHGSRALIEGVDLSLSAGELASVVGENGSGKTTLLRGLAGLRPALRGRVLRRVDRLAYVPQREALDAEFPFTVLEFVLTGARRGPLEKWRTRRTDLERASARLDGVGLRDRERLPFSALSGGQRQRALIARALVSEPQLLFLDEPTSGVDTRAEQGILELLERERDRGLAIVFVSHRLEELTRAADHLWRVERGTVRSTTVESGLGVGAGGAF